MRKYKLVVLLKGDRKKEEKSKLLGDVMKWAGKLEKETVTELGEKKLAYSIKGQRKADYSLIEFEADTLEKDLEKRIQMSDDIIRHLLIRVK